MSRTRLNPRLAKLHRSYTVEEVARLYGLHRNTVRSWIKRDGLPTIDGGRPVLIRGADLRVFLDTRRRAAKRPCPPGTLYCFKCRAPRAPALGMADFVVGERRAGNIAALCETCGASVHRGARRSALAAILPGIEVRIVEGPPHIAECGVRSTLQIRRDAGFLKAASGRGEFFILGGQTAYVAEVGEPIKAPNGEFDARLRVIYSNGTESNLLLRSLQRALYKDETSRRVSEPSAGPLFSDEAEPDDLESGTIYVLRSLSDHPTVAGNRELIHKIGVTGGKVEQRIAGARVQPTYLMADVEVVATYKLFNINRTRLENLIHRIFEPARLDIAIPDRFGRTVTAREWFLVPLFVIQEAMERIKDGSITGYRYDPKSATLKLSDNRQSA
jgi:excisionase family DNA binding protein